MQCPARETEKIVPARETEKTVSTAPTLEFPSNGEMSSGTPVNRTTTMGRLAAVATDSRRASCPTGIERVVASCAS